MKKPIIIVSSGRAGSTIFHSLLSEHPNIAWLSMAAHKYPKNPKLNNYIMQAADLPIIKGLVRKKFWPAEPYNFWDRYARGFSKPCRDLKKLDVTPVNKKKLYEAFSVVPTTKRNRLMVKVTGWPRIGFLQEVFKDAIFIHIKRDPIATINSFLQIDFWRGWHGPHQWRWGALSDEEMTLWNRYDKSFVALACIQMRIYQRAIDESRKEAKNFLEISYEDLCKNHIKICKQVASFCSLPNSDEFERRLEKRVVKNSNYKWKKDLSLPQQQILKDFFKE